MMQGLHVFPCKMNKAPDITKGFYTTSNDPAVIALWRKKHFLMGAPTGAVNGWDVLDIDLGGDKWLATQNLPETRIHETRSGGLHFFFKHHPGLGCSASTIAPGVDVRSTGGYVIWWPWTGCKVLSDAPIAPWPGPMLELLHEITEAESTNPPVCVSPMIYQKTSNEIPKPLYSKVCALMPDSRGQDRRRVISGLRDLLYLRDGRNKALLKKAAFFREALISTGVIDSGVARELLFMASQINGYVEKCGKDFALRTIDSAFRYQTINDTQMGVDFSPDEYLAGEKP
jgi:hypothetical protein